MAEKRTLNLTHLWRIYEDVRDVLFMDDTDPTSYLWWNAVEIARIIPIPGPEAVGANG